MEKVPGLEALLLTFLQGLELGAFAKHNQYCLAIVTHEILWSGTINTPAIHKYNG